MKEILRKKVFDFIESILKDESFTPKEAPDSLKYFSIPIEQYLSAKKSQFDIFLRIGEGKYIKVLHRGESLDHTFINKLISKDVSYLYINKSKLALFLQIQKKVLEKTIVSHHLDLDVKSYVLLGQGQQIVRMFQELELKSCLANLEIFLSTLLPLIEEYKLKYKKDFSYQILQEGLHYDHCIMVTLFSLIIARDQKILSQKLLRSIALASLFHDVSLGSQTARDTDSENYKNHPLESVNMLSHLPYFEASTLQSIRQHHMRLRGESFPERMKNEVLSQNSQIIGLSDDLNRFFQEFKSEIYSEKNGQAKMILEETILNQVSRSLLGPTMKDLLIKLRLCS